MGRYLEFSTIPTFQLGHDIKLEVHRTRRWGMTFVLAYSLFYDYIKIMEKQIHLSA